MVGRLPTPKFGFKPYAATTGYIPGLCPSGCKYLEIPGLGWGAFRHPPLHRAALTAGARA